MPRLSIKLLALAFCATGLIILFPSTVLASFGQEDTCVLGCYSLFRADFREDWKHIGKRQYPQMYPEPTETPLPTPRPPTCDITGAEQPPLRVSKLLVVDQTCQMMYAFEDGVLIRAIPVSTGVRNFFTPAYNGRVDYYVPSLYSDGHWMDHAWYITEATGDIYIHGAPYTRTDDGKSYIGMESLGIRPASHGCIRVHPQDAQWLVQWQIIGIRILVNAPDFKKFSD